ncbi:hypothetical protein [Exiguobacterium antarcticum]|uniref:Uncharacterized protein n=1 Tax=Exiguobacterium antarcticum TaxID=132920 RepID=A0ABT6R602_9BACL|nr:hypothetical protein [Exiguobacterium antarcticum]MDI3236393.1 hypothetical protein [Exiguobacterium antarcticum]
MSDNHIHQFRYRESGMGEEQLFTWTAATRELRLEEGTGEETIILLSGRQQQELTRRLEKAKVIDWQPVYTTEWLILDGTDWEIRWSNPDGDGTSRGSNAFPDKWELLRDWLYSQFEIREEEIR